MILKKLTLACAATALMTSTGFAATMAGDVLDTYANIAQAKYEDSLTTAKALDSAVDAFLADPSPSLLDIAKSAWLAARVPYQQSEVYRFGNAIVDDWEGRVNAWPLDEGLIDYVDASYGMESDDNSLFTANVIANPSLSINGETINASSISPDLIANTLHEAGEIESNVASGYHAIEFLLWGQDLNGTNAGSGNRPFTDFATDNCTNGNCDRRAQYLASATDLLVADLEEMVANWTASGAARSALTADGENTGISIMLTGMGSLSYGELAGERMKLGLLLNDPEEEHDCFSDNTHNSHLYDAKGVQNVYLGKYTRLDGTVVEGASLSNLVSEANAGLDAELRGKLDTTMAAMAAMAERADGGEAYDQMIGEGNEAGNAAVQAAIDGLIDQTKSIERVVAALDLDTIAFEGSDSLDSPDSVFE